MDGTRIRLGEHSLANSVQDNGFSMQSQKFDYLLDLDGNIIKPAIGELYVPVSYMRMAPPRSVIRRLLAGRSLSLQGSSGIHR